VNAVNLFKNDTNAIRRTLVARKFGDKLFGPTGNDPKRRGNLVCNSDGERSHDRRPSGPFQALVALTADIRELQAVSQEKLLALVAHRQAAEAEHESARGRHAQNQPPTCPALAIALTVGAGDRHNSPSSCGAGIHARQPREGRADGKPKAARLGWRQTQVGLALFKRTKDFWRDDESPIGGMKTRRMGWLDKDHATVRIFGRSG
jgi:hypothetical protein